jgi:uncharacterized lipoprotein YmbA
MMSARGTCVVALLALAGCASAPPETFYTLSSGLRGEAVSGPRPARTVVVTRAAVAEVVDRPQLVVEGSGHRVAILEQQRWAEPLRAGISRVVAEDLERLLGGWRVSTRDEVLAAPDCRVTLDVRRFAYTRAAAIVTVDALWTVTCLGGERHVGESTVHEPVADASVEAVVTAQGRALGPVSRDVARTLQAQTDTARAHVTP